MTAYPSICRDQYFSWTFTFVFQHLHQWLTCLGLWSATRLLGRNAAEILFPHKLTWTFSILPSLPNSISYIKPRGVYYPGLPFFTSFTTPGSLMDGIHGFHEDENIFPSSAESPKQRRTPLSWLQISIMLLLHTCEPISSQSIYPYINEVLAFFFTCSAPSC